LSFKICLKGFQTAIAGQVVKLSGWEGGLAPALSYMTNHLRRIVLSSALSFVCLFPSLAQAQLTPAGPGAQPAHPTPEYLWYEAENMRGFATKTTGEPIQNPSWMNLPKAKAPGWGINGPGVSAEWSQGGESEWNSAAASADETNAKIYQDLEIPRAGKYKVWVRYADWANLTENFVVRITQRIDTTQRGDGELFHHEFGAKDVVDPHDEVSMYWGWAFAWDGIEVQLAEGPVRLSIEIEKPSEARRHVDCVLLTNDLAYVPEGAPQAGLRRRALSARMDHCWDQAFVAAPAGRTGCRRGSDWLAAASACRSRFPDALEHQPGVLETLRQAACRASALSFQCRAD
jgi:hypothetical protein